MIRHEQLIRLADATNPAPVRPAARRRAAAPAGSGDGGDRPAAESHTAAAVGGLLHARAQGDSASVSTKRDEDQAMGEQRETCDAGRQRLDEVIGEFLVALDAGQNPNPRERLSRYPELCPELAEFFADRERMDELVEPLRIVSGFDNGRSRSANRRPPMRISRAAVGRCYGPALRNSANDPPGPCRLCSI